MKTKEKRKQYLKEYYLKNKDKIKKQKKQYHLKNRYNITPEQLDNLYLEQNDCCKICGIHKDDTSRGLVIDHDHKTMEVRGLLCNEHNLMLGLSKDNIEVLEKSIEYLKTKGKFN